MVNKFQSSLYKALKYISLNGAKLCYFDGNKIYSSHNDVILCHEIEQDLTGCFNIEILMKALDKFGESVTWIELKEILQLKNNNLQINIQNDESYSIHMPMVERMNWKDAESFIESIQMLHKVPTKSGESLLTSFHCSGNTLWVTNRRCILESWHGLNLPKFSFSRECGQTIFKIKPRISEICVIDKHVIFKFNDICYLSSSLIKVDEFDHQQFFETENELSVNDELKNGLNEVLYCHGETIEFSSNRLSSGPSNYNIDLSITTISFYSEEMKYFCKYGDYFTIDEERFIFANEENTFRGVVSKFYDGKEEDEND